MLLLISKQRQPWERCIDHWRQDHWVVLFSHPASFTPVCTTELAAVQRLNGAFEKRNVRALALAEIGRAHV